MEHNRNIIDEPPALIKGRALPVGGIDDVATATCIKNCASTITVKPRAVWLPKKSSVFMEILSPLHANTTNPSINNKQPAKPSSSPIIENIKSL